MANLEKVIRITEDDYSTLLGGGTITKDGVTYTYDESALYVIQNEDPPAYAETAGVANTAVADSAGNNIAATYDKKPLVIEVDDTDTSVPQGTYASITAALAEGREVLMKVTMTVNDGEIEYMRIRRDYSYANGSYTFYNNYYTVEVLENNSIDILFESADNHFHGNITREGKLQTTDITIANGDKLVVTDASNSNKVARASLAFDGSTTTQALSKKGTWETFAKPTMVVTITRSGTYPNFIYTANKTYAEIGAALEAGTNVVLVQNNYYYWFYAKGSGSTPDLVFKRVTDADMQPVSDGSINYIQSYKITINSSNTLTFSSDIIDLTGKVDKVTSTDNAIARYDGTGGQIQNSGVTINDSNHVTAAKFITSGGTSSQFVKGDGSLDSGYYIKNGDYIINTRAALENNVKLRIYDRELQDCFWAANIRFVATHKVYNNSDDSFVKDISTDLFKGSYESWGNTVTVDQYAILYLGYIAEEDLLDNTSTTNSMAVYPSGKIILQFYTSKRPGEILEAKGFFRNDTDWRDLTVTTNNSVTYFISVPNVNYLKAIRIKYSGSNLGSEGVTSLTDVSFIRQRDDIASRDIVTKYPVEQTLYGNVTAPKFITRGGTSSQFVKGNGSLDSTTYTPQTVAGANSLLSSLPDWTATPTDTTKLVRRDTGGSASFGQVTFLTVWNYINSKAATVYAPLASPALTDTPTAPTAIAGTNTTQIATTAFVQNAVTSAIAGVTQFNYQVVTTLPATGQKGTIYLISNGGSGQNIYDEYIWYEDTEISGRWEKIGTTEVDLSGYAKLSPTSTQVFTGDHMLKGTITVNNPASGGSLPLPSEIAVGSNGKITLAGEGDFSKVISGSVTLQDALDDKQGTLVSGTNIKTIDSNSLLGSGNVEILPYAGNAITGNIDAVITPGFYKTNGTVGSRGLLVVNSTLSGRSTIITQTRIVNGTAQYRTGELLNDTVSSWSAWSDVIDLSTYAPLASPALTGTPTAPTAASGTNTTQVATTAFVQNALSNMGAGGSEMVDVTITGTTSSASFSTNPYNAIKAVVDDGKIAVLNASVAPLSATGVLIPVYEYTYSQSGSDFTGYKGKIQNGNYEISVDVQSTSSSTVTISNLSEKEIFWVNCTFGNPPSLDKTYADISTAIGSGKEVILNVASGMLFLRYVHGGDPRDIYFTNIVVENGEAVVYTLSLTSQNVITVGTVSLGLPSVTSSDNGKVLKVVNGAWDVAEDTDTQQTLISMGIDEGAKSGSSCYFNDASGNELTHAQVSALIEDNTKDVVISHYISEDAGTAYFRMNGYYANIKGGTKSLSNGAKAYFTGFAQRDSKWYNITLTWNNNAFTAECVAIGGGSGNGISFYRVDKASLPWVFYDVNNDIVDHSTILAALYENPISLVFVTDTDLGETVVLRYNSNDFGLGSYTGSSPYEPTMVSIIEFGDRNDTLTCDYSEYTFAQSRSLTVTINGTIASPSFAANPYQDVYELAHYGNLPVLNANINPLSMTGVQIPVYSYTYQVSGTNYTGYRGLIQKSNYEIAVDIKSSGSTVSITSVGSSITVDTALSESSTNPVQNRVITAQILENEEIVATALNNLNDRVELKQDQLVSGTTIKTINNQSILGSGNISISGGGGGGGGDVNVIEVVKVNGTALTPDANKAVNVVALQPDTAADLGQGTLTATNSQGFDFIIADEGTSSEQTLQDALDAKASTSAVNAKYTKPSGGIPDTDLTTAVNVRLLAQLSSSSDDGKIMKYSYSAGSWQAVKPVTIYSGSSAPSSSTGSNGDIYIQTS